MHIIKYQVNYFEKMKFICAVRFYLIVVQKISIKGSIFIIPKTV